MSWTWHIQYWPRRQYRHFQQGTICSEITWSPRERSYFSSDPSPRATAEDHRRLAIPLSDLISPEQGGTRMALHVAGTYPCTQDASDDLPGTELGKSYLLESVVLRAVTHNSLHR
jgi:hypothetical protein